MSDTTFTAPPTASAPADLTGRVVLVPGGTGTVGTGVVAAHLAAGADVVVPTRHDARAEQLRTRLGTIADVAGDRLHLITHDYTSFTGATDLVEQVAHHRGGLDAVVAPIGGWWAGGALTTIRRRTGSAPSPTWRPRTWPSCVPACPT